MEVAYVAKCVANDAAADGSRAIKLLYDRELNSHPPKIASEIAWGTTTLMLARDKAIARYEAIEPKWSGPALRCELLAATLFAERKRRLVQIAQRTGQQRLREALFRASRSPRCAVTGETVRRVLEAAHIIDDARNGVAATANGLLLRADLHRLFDVRPKDGRLGEADHMTISGAGEVLFSPSLRKHPFYRAYHGEPLSDRGAFMRVRSSLQAAEELHRPRRKQAG